MNRERFDGALTFDSYLETVVKNRELWHAVSETFFKLLVWCPVVGTS
ncbi:MAG: hypothetical protein ACKVIN_05745 [Longimicrobiales bacterium]